MRTAAQHAAEPVAAGFELGPLAKLITACCVNKAKPKLDRLSWGEIELCREALRCRDFARAKVLYHALLNKAQRRFDLPLEARVLNDLAFLHRLVGDVLTADSLYKRAYRVWKSLPPAARNAALSDYCHCVLDYAAFLRTVGRNADAVQLENRIDELTAQLSTAYFAFSRAELLVARGQDDDAERAYEQCLVDAALSKDLDLQLRATDRIAPLYRRLGKEESAQTMEMQRRRLQMQRGERLFDKRSAHMTAMRRAQEIQSKTWVILRPMPPQAVNELSMLRVKQMDSRFLTRFHKAS
jgi:tetratricopeptide (TPR) repeat protein